MIVTKRKQEIELLTHGRKNKEQEEIDKVDIKKEKFNQKKVGKKPASTEIEKEISKKKDNSALGKETLENLKRNIHKDHTDDTTEILKLEDTKHQGDIKHLEGTIIQRHRETGFRRTIIQRPRGTEDSYLNTILLSRLEFLLGTIIRFRPVITRNEVNESNEVENVLSDVENEVKGYHKKRRKKMA